MSSINELSSDFHIGEWDTMKEARGNEEGLITLEYFDSDRENTSSEENEKEEKELSTRLFDSVSTTPPSTSSSTQTLVGNDMADFKTYDFMHSDAEQDYLLTEGDMFVTDYHVQEPDGSSVIKGYTIPEKMRGVMDNYYKVTHRERMKSLLNSNEIFTYCPRGECPDSTLLKKRKQAGPFVSCSFSSSHEGGDDFISSPAPLQILPEFSLSERPPHLREKKHKFYKECRSCEAIGFTHHRNPARHYHDYLDKVTYHRNKNHTKVWRQHLADKLNFLNESDPQYEEIQEKCEDYDASPNYNNAFSYNKPQTASRRRNLPVLVRKASAVIRRPNSRAAPFQKPNSQFKMRKTNKKPSTRELHLDEDTKTENSYNDQSTDKMVMKASPKSTKSMIAASTVKNTQTRNEKPASATKINKTIVKQKSSSRMQERMKVSMTKLIQIRQARPEPPKTFVKPQQSKTKRRVAPRRKGDTKHIQKLKPNISAKFLRMRSKSKGNASKLGMKTVNPSTSGRKSSKKLVKISNNSKSNKKISENEDESGDETYAEFRDRNGNFDPEKYRRSVLNMLNPGSGARRTKKKKSKSNRQGLAASPKVRNLYRNIKSKTSSNFQTRQSKSLKKKSAKSKTTPDSAGFETLYENTISDISLKSKYSNERYVGTRGKLTQMESDSHNIQVPTKT